MSIFQSFPHLISADIPRKEGTRMNELSKPNTIQASEPLFKKKPITTKGMLTCLLQILLAF